MTRFVQNTRHPPHRSARLGGVSALAFLLLSGCGGGGVIDGPVPTQVHLEPPPPAAAQDTAAPRALPALQVDEVAGSNGGARRIQMFSAQDEDLRVVVRELAEGLGLDYRVAPGVSGRVSIRLRDVTPEEALEAVVGPHGYHSEIQDGVVFVGPVQLESRLFSLDYVALSRVGQSATVLQRRLGMNQGQGGSFGGQTGQQGGGGQTGQQGFGGGGGDFITSTSVADLWDDIRISLEGLIFSEAMERASETPGGGRSGVSSGARAFTRVGELGHRLIINPMAGTIHVNASPAQLTEVADFLRVFEASVQRQVLIEARIVEVTLDRQFEFGIDWSAIRRIGNVNLEADFDGGGSGSSQFRLSGGTEQITAVLQTLSEQGNVRVLSSPQVSALNNQRAVFNVTTDEIIFTVSRQPIIGPGGVPIGFTTDIQPNQIAVGIILDVFPQIGPDNTVSMNIRPAITNVARVETIRTADGNEARAPVIDRREIDTFARVRPGETVVIGGLMRTRMETQHTGIPGLKDLPLLGYFFGRRVERETRGELIIFITPTIVTGQLREGN